MNEYELRIGNWVNGNYNGFSKDVEIYEFDRNEIRHSDGKQIPIPISNFKPIPLTEQWLDDLGIIKINKNHWKFALGLTIEYDGGFFWLETDNDYTEIENVHQLQNLYFALTGNELERSKPSKETNGN